MPKHPTTRQGLLALGMTAQMIRTAVASGRLHRIRQGVFIDALAWPEDSREQHLMRAAAELEVHPGAVLSHGSAAASWGLPHPGFTQWHERPVSITLPLGGTARSRPTPVVAHRVATLPAGHVTRDVDGRRITSLARTAFDLSLRQPLPDALVVLDGAARALCAGMVANPRRGDYANTRLAATVREVFRQAAHGRTVASVFEAIELCDPRRESAVESMSAGHFQLAGLPTPDLQVRVETPTGDAYPDFYWSASNLIGECDGAIKYADERGYVREKDREQQLRDLGYRVVRWQAKEILLCPQVVVDRVARSLG